MALPVTHAIIPAAALSPLAAVALAVAAALVATALVVMAVVLSSRGRSAGRGAIAQLRATHSRTASRRRIAA